MYMYIHLLEAAEQAETPEEARLILEELKRLQNNRKQRKQQAD